MNILDEVLERVEEKARAEKKRYQRSYNFRRSMYHNFLTLLLTFLAFLTIRSTYNWTLAPLWVDTIVFVIVPIRLSIFVYTYMSEKFGEKKGVTALSVLWLFFVAAIIFISRFLMP